MTAFRLFISLFTIFIPFSAHAIDPVALLCIPPTFEPCSEQNAYTRIGKCQPGLSVYTLSDGTEMCMLAGLPDDLANECIAQHKPNLAMVHGFSRNFDRTIGMEGPFGIIFSNSFLGKNFAEERFIMDDKIIDRRSSYEANQSTVKTTWLGVTDRKTLLNRDWVPCRISSRREIERAQTNHLRQKSRGNKF